MMRHYTTCAFALLATSALTAAAIAHESRTLPASKNFVELTVGFAAEPAFEDSFNGVDVILAVDDGDCPAAAGAEHGGAPHISAPIDTKAGDTVNLQVGAIYLNTAVPPTGANGSDIPATAGWRGSKVITKEYPLKAKFGVPGTYQSFFRPTNPGPGTGPNSGAYAFRIYGQVKTLAKQTLSCGGTTPKPMAARTININSVFVCGPNGTMSLEGSYNCIKSIQTFPGDAAEGYKPSVKF